jgi:pyruvate/2-oxoglutarate dehydrogenase complex dihydrolipoamide acyltransferase (E2) component
MAGKIVEVLANEEDTVSVGQDLFRIEPGEFESGEYRFCICIIFLAGACEGTWRYCHLSANSVQGSTLSDYMDAWRFHAFEPCGIVLAYYSRHSLMRIPRIQIGGVQAFRGTQAGEVQAGGEFQAGGRVGRARETCGEAGCERTAAAKA